MKPFNLEDYLNNPDKLIVTRKGLAVRIICTDRNNERPIIALIKEKDGPEIIQCYFSNGAVCTSKCSEWDLMFASTKKEGWSNIYKTPDGDMHIGRMYSSKGVAEDMAKHFILRNNYIATAKIEWEE